ncbi:hypothetical protein GALMADRAFT_141147 [Galerina marginata CBS 339.88]|uniref:SET domain-containing protein n=1 Tax=Galerina marginata (strain CBS 339.88) TaxID=685588 RepID=A0A067T4F0_GALM3|nr:hypothetical protein GALMADRAFT_141147 [Galerina marginata CBS 339.88]
MKRGFLNKPQRKGPPVETAAASTAKKDTVTESSAASTQKEQPKLQNPTPTNETTSPTRPELENLTFVTVPPRRPNMSDDRDGHVELLVPSYGNALKKIQNTPGYPKPVPKTPQKNYIIKQTEDMGIAMFATRDLQKGDLIFAERPYLCASEAVIASDVFDQAIARNLPPEVAVKFLRGLSEKRLQHMVSRMSEADKASIMHLANSHDDEEDTGPMTGRLRTNCYTVKTKLWDDVHSSFPDGKGGTMKLGYLILGKDVSRINHSCMPNGKHSFDIASFSIQFFAVKPIKSGEQIFYSYAEPQDPLAVRRPYLERYRIDCKCYACTNSSPEIEAFRREFPQKIQALINKCNDMIGGLPVLGKDGQARPPIPRKPINPSIIPRLKKEVLEPLLRLQTDIEREGFGFYRETTNLWMVLSRTWEAIPGDYAAKMCRKAFEEMGVIIKLWDH